MLSEMSYDPLKQFSLLLQMDCQVSLPIKSHYTKNVNPSQPNKMIVAHLSDDRLLSQIYVNTGRCSVVGSTLAFGSTGRGFNPERRYFSHHSASPFSKLRSLT
jgi:hypothetical protein